jgi:predicted dehydrogenase
MKKVRVGFIGAGWWATANHIPILAARDDVELAAVCRLGATELRQVQHAFNFPFATEDAAELVAQPLDAVVVTSPHTLHYEHARLAIDRGLHVMIDKPMCTRAAHARELVGMAEARGVHVVVPYGWHYKSFVQTAKCLLDERAVGRIEFVMCHMASPIRELLAGRPFEVRGNSGQAGGNLFNPDPATWADPKVAGGGYGHAQLSHSTGMLCWLTGLRAEAVFARMTAPGAQVDLYDAISVRFAGGAVGTVSGAGTVPVSGMSSYQVDIRIFGSEGLLMIDLERARLELRRHDGMHRHVDVDSGAGAYDCSGPPHNFIDLIRGTTTNNYAPGEAAMRTVELLDAAYRSAASGQEETVQ